MPLEELDVRDEAREYARRWWGEENDTEFHLGYANFEARRAMVYAVEIARLCCSGREAIPFARRLAQLLVEELGRLPIEPA